MSKQKHENVQRVAALMIALTALCVSSQAVAQESDATGFTVEHFEPLPSQGTNILNIGKSDMLGHLTPSAGLFLHLANSPIRLVSAEDQDETEATLIKNQLKAELWGSIGLFDIAEIGFVLPIVAFQSGDDLTQLDPALAGQSIKTFAIADPRIVPKIRVPVAPEKLGGFGFAVAAPIFLPLGDESSFNSDGGLRFEPRAIVDWRHPVGIAVAGNFGYAIRPTSTSQNIAIDDTLRYGLGVELPTGLDNFQIIGSFFGNIPLEGDISDELENHSNPREILGGLQFKLPFHLVANVGGGAGLSSGVGSPRFRVFGSIGYTPMVKDSDGDGFLDEEDGCPKDAEDKDGFEDGDGCPDLDNDADGILDADDQCPMDAEDKDTFEDDDGCPDPDNDKDGITDVEDKCPLEPGVAKKQGCPFNDKDNDGIEDGQDLCPDDPEDKDGFEDEDGCPDPDNDADGILDGDDKCPLEKEDMDKFEDEDGCPDPDNDKDGILDADDKCPLKPETYNGNKDDDGCPDGKETVVITKTEIKILQKVFFDTGKDTIQRKSYSLLDTVATVLNQNPQVTRIRIEGHTDDIGSDAKNLDLSKRRAAAVRNYLKDKGVAESRIESEGYGEEKPLCKDIPEKMLGKKSRKYNNCRADNRRVEFKIVEVNGKKVEADDSVTIKKKEVIEEPIKK